MNREVLIFLLAILIVSSFIELAYGSIYLGLIFLVLSGLMLIMLSKEMRVEEGKRSILAMMFGIAIIVADLAYNYIYKSEIQTFDSMVILLGLSIALSASGTRYSDLGRFGVYFSSVFLVFFITLFIIPGKLNIDLPYYYGHYFVTVPSVLLLSSLGLNVKVPEKRLIEVFGVQNLTLKIDLACFGWYSMLLITSMLLSYHLTIQRLKLRRLVKILSIMLIACYLANLLRVSILVSTAYYYGLDTMMLIHSHIGWILFALVLIPLSYMIESNSKSKHK
mgnify:CR=1 FL=1